MRFLTLFTVLSLLTTTKTQAQNVEYGQVWKADFHGYSPKILHENDNYLYSCEYFGDKLYLEVFDKQKLQSDKKHIIEMPEWEKTSVELMVYSFIGDQLVLFLDLNKRRENKSVLLAVFIDEDQGNIKDQIEISSYDYSRTSHNIYYSIDLAPDRNSFVLNTIVYDEDKENTVQTIVKFNSDFEEEHRREFFFNGDKIEVSTNSLIDNDGTLYFIRGNTLVSMDPFNEFEEYSEVIPTDDLAVNGSLVNWALDINPKGDLVLTALYQTTDTEDQRDANKRRSDRKEGDTQIEGAKYFEYDPLNQEFVASKLTLFDQDFIDIFRSDDDKEDQHVGEINQDFSHVKLLFDDNNNAYMIGQARRDVYIYNQNGGVSSYQAYYDELMILAFSEDGSIKWQERIPIRGLYFWSQGLFYTWASSEGMTFFSFPFKSQYYYGYSATIVDEELQIIYNDDPVNRAGKMQDQELDKLKRLKNSQPVVQRLNVATGERIGYIENKLTKPELYIKPRLVYYSEMDKKYYYFITRKKMIQFCAAEL